MPRVLRGLGVAGKEDVDFGASLSLPRVAGEVGVVALAVEAGVHRGGLMSRRRLVSVEGFFADLGLFASFCGQPLKPPHPDAGL